MRKAPKKKEAMVQLGARVTFRTYRDFKQMCCERGIKVAQAIDMLMAGELNVWERLKATKKKPWETWPGCM